MNKDFIQELRALGINTVDTNTRYYSTTRYTQYANFNDINKDTKITTLKYKDKIGYNLKNEIKLMLKRRNETILMVANAGGGKTYSIMQCTCELLEEEKQKAIMEAIREELDEITVKDNKVAYVLPVPNTSQAWQNEVSEDLKKFGYTKVVGVKEGKRIKINAKKPLYSPVYDKTLETVEELKKQGYEVVLIVDECHKLVKDTYRHKALLELDIAITKADLTIMMTATPRMNLKYYKYDEIFKLEDLEVKNNLQLLRPIYTKNWSITLLKEIRKAIKKGLKPLIRLNSKKEIEVFIEKLKEAGISSAMLTSETKDSEIFKSIQENGTVGDTAQVLFCTSVIECGISLKATDIIPVEVIRTASDFDKDNSVQFFARPRKQVAEGIMIIKQYDINLNTNKNSILELHDFKWYYEKVSKMVNAQYSYIKAQLEMNLETKGFEYAKEQLEIEIAILKNNKNVINVIEADLNTLNVYIDNKKLIQRVYSEMDKDIVVKSPLQLRKIFKDLIFYEDEVKIEVDEVYNNLKDLIDNGVKPKLSDSKEDKRLLEILNKNKIKANLEDIVLDIYDETLDMNMVKELQTHKLYEYIKEQVKTFNDINYLKEIRREVTNTRRLKEEDYRELLNDKNFVKAIPDIAEKKVTSDNIKKYGLDISLHDIIDFRETGLFKQIWDTSKVFSSKEAIMIAKHKYKDSKGNEKYISKADVKDICEIKYFIEKSKDFKGLTKYDLIYNILINKKLRTDKNGKNKLVQINLTDDLKTEIITELVRNKFYTKKEISEAVKEIEMEMFLMENADEYEFYSKENIKKLEKASSSQLKNKVMKDISKIFRIGEDSKGYPAINAPLKKFSLEKYIKENY